MRLVNSSLWNGWLFFGVIMYITWSLLLPCPALAQCNTGSARQGFNAVYGNCSPVNPQGAFTLVDATQYTSGGTDICVRIQNVLSQYNPYPAAPLVNGVVIDARGFSGTMTCATNPWQSSDTPAVNFSNVVLLPAGTITLSHTLVLPHDTRLVGEGSGLTTLQACTTSGCFTGTGDMIDMGNLTLCQGSNSINCEGVVIEHLALTGSGSLKGIVNQYSQELSRVDDVSLTNFSGGIGLSLDTHSNNSGPYTNISYSGSGVCAEIYGGGSGSLGTSEPPINQTRGIHGLTCNMTGGSGPAIYLDAPNNSLEDVYIQGSGSSQDGIYVGSKRGAYNNVLFNVLGSGLENVIRLSSAGSGSPFYNNVRDVSILGVTCTGSSGCPGNSIKDELTSTNLTDTNVGMYLVGEPVTKGSGSDFTNIGYSRFTTSTNASAVTWLVGSNPPPASSCAAGSLYSCTNSSYCNISTEIYTLWGCIGTGWSHIK
jgi:hypothetical protein